MIRKLRENPGLLWALAYCGMFGVGAVLMYQAVWGSDFQDKSGLGLVVVYVVAALWLVSPALIHWLRIGERRKREREGK